VPVHLLGGPPDAAESIVLFVRSLAGAHGSHCNRYPLL
jgi:hypothetical protein